MTRVTFWGVTASPYLLKMQSIADFAELSWKRLPEQGNLVENLGFVRRLRKAQAAGQVRRFCGYDPDMDEYPAVPYYTLDGDSLYYDSSDLAAHLDTLGNPAPTLLPNPGATRILCRLIDEAFDEFGLYMVHHNRWVTSAKTNVMGEMTAREFGPWLPAPIRGNIAGRLARRQSQRCPYLFSVAPDGFDAGVDSTITPPARAGFPPTHELLDQAWRGYLAAMEQLLSQQPYLLGQRFTLADASAYGQLGMNLVDGRSAELLQEQAPRTFQWLCMINEGEHRGSTGPLVLTEAIAPLLKCIVETFVPLMQQNEAAYEQAVASGQGLFNEKAFDRGEALYDGSLMGMPFRSVAKSFQVATWRRFGEEWRALKHIEREQLAEKFPLLQDPLFSNNS